MFDIIELHARGGAKTPFVGTVELLHRPCVQDTLHIAQDEVALNGARSKRALKASAVAHV